MADILKIQSMSLFVTNQLCQLINEANFGIDIQHGIDGIDIQASVFSPCQINE